MEEIILLEREAYNITLNPEKEMLSVNLIADVKYDEDGFQEFLKYFENVSLLYFGKITLLSIPVKNSKTFLANLFFTSVIQFIKKLKNIPIFEFLSILVN